MKPFDIRERDVFVYLEEDEGAQIAYVTILRQKRVVRVLGFAFKTLFCLVCVVLACDVAWAWRTGVFDRLVR
jgi:hypothetical protein